ncbi:MAG: response regulator [Candidatus Firestonebacteria bacterium]|nr:response regulator [Candidatus Firestonebacteria bacterium]
MKRILIVEDEAIIAEDIRKTLEKNGYAVSGLVNSGEDALKKLDEEHSQSHELQNKTGLVLMDIVLRNSMDGIETAEIIRSHYNIPIIYLTAYSDNATIELTKKTEPFGYIIKPFNERELFTTIELAIYKHRMDNNLNENRKWLSTVLNSIGDAVITTDIRGRITFMNPAGELLTAWNKNDAFNKELEEVYNIIDEKTGDKIEMHILQVINDSITKVINNIILVSKDIKYKFVDCVIAPIKDTKGRISGVVLVFRDITKMHKTEQKIIDLNEELIKLNIELKTLDQMKNNFLSNISHELKSPLVTIKGYTELILAGKSGHLTSLLKHQLSISLKNIDTLMMLIERLLSFSRMEFHMEKLCIEYFDIIELARESINSIKLRAENKDIKINEDFISEHLSIKADKKKLYQVFINLLDNAVKFTPSGGLIVIKIDKEEKAKLRVSIKDTGIGIPEKALNKVFNRFYQVDDSSTRKFGGMGIGLSISSDIISLHNGKITVESEEGKGSIFTFTIPI